MTRLVTKQAPRLADVSQRMTHVAGAEVLKKRLPVVMDLVLAKTVADLFGIDVRPKGKSSTTKTKTQSIAASKAKKSQR